MKLTSVRLQQDLTESLGPLSGHLIRGQRDEGEDEGVDVGHVQVVGGHSI